MLFIQNFVTNKDFKQESSHPILSLEIKYSRTPLSPDDLDIVGEKKPESLIYHSWLITLMRCNPVWLFSIKEFTVTANDQFPCAIYF